MPGFLQRGCFVGGFPGEGVLGAAEMPECGGLAINGTAKLQMIDHPFGRQLEVRADQFHQTLFFDGLPVPNVSTMTETGSATPIA